MLLGAKFALIWLYWEDWPEGPASVGACSGSWGVGELGVRVEFELASDFALGKAWAQTYKRSLHVDN